MPPQSILEADRTRHEKDSAIPHGSSGKESHRSASGIRVADVFGVGVLLVVTSLAWCTANGKWTTESWGLPTRYLEAEYSDFIGTCGWTKAMAAGHFLPYGMKTVSDLGAPGTADWNRSPTPEEALSAVEGGFTWLCGFFSGFNLIVLLGHLAAAATFYAVARSESCTTAWAGVAALAFGLAPYLFAESPHHINCQYVWYIPLFLVVWKWIATEPGIEIGSRRFWQAIGIGFLTGLQNPYYTFIFCQLVLLGAAVAAWRTRSRGALLTAGAIVGAAAFAFLLGNLDTLAYRIQHGAGGQPVVAQREYRWMDIYGFKLVDLFIPSITHHSATLAKFGLAHRQASVLNDEEGCAYLGVVGGVSLLFLVGTTVRALLDGKLPAVPMAAWQVLWIVLFFNTGGLNSTIAAFTGFTLFRTACRYSVVILAIVLLYAAQRLSSWQRESSRRVPSDTLQIGLITAMVGLCLLILWDQVPRSPTAEQQATIAQQVAADRDFVAGMEEALPAKAMVFQLPVMDGSPLPGVPSSDHFRPYLSSKQLHFSHGAARGSDALQWQQAVQQQLLNGATLNQQTQQIQFNQNSVSAAVDEMRKKGFAAIYVNRNGFPDRGKGLEKSLLELGYLKPLIDSAAGDLFCIPLEKN
jgi:phosphoglycerol transferase